MLFLLFFFNDTATTEIYTLSLHDALPISAPFTGVLSLEAGGSSPRLRAARPLFEDRKSTRLNSSHTVISYAVFCLKKKKDASAGPGKSPNAARPRAKSSRPPPDRGTRPTH